MASRSLNGLAPDYLRSKFTDRNNVSTYSLRDTRGKLAIPLPRTNFMKTRGCSLEYPTRWSVSGWLQAILPVISHVTHIRQVYSSFYNIV